MKQNYKSTWCICFLLLFSHPTFCQFSFIDPTFGNNGTVIHNFCGKNYATYGTTQPDGKIVMIGYADATSPSLKNFAIARYTIDGLIDSTFSNDGIDTVDLNGYYDEARHVIVDSAGRILVTGESIDWNGDKFISIVRYNPDGTYDNTFSGDGKMSHSLSSIPVETNAIMIRSNGKIMVAGNYDNIYDDPFIMQFNNDGSPDTSFANAGLSIVNLPLIQYCDNLIEQPDGKIIVSGYHRFSSSQYGCIIIRFNSNGSLDSTFNNTGILLDPVVSRQSMSMVIQPDGKILISGPCNHNPTYHSMLARYMPDGSVDSTFGINGKVEMAFGNTSSVFKEIILQPDNKILAATYGSLYIVQLARFNADGSVDQSFGVNGIIENYIGTSTNHTESVRIQPNGKIVMMGWSAVLSGTGNDVDFSMIRYGLNVNTGISEVVENNELIVYPNPVSNSATISWKGLNTSVKTFNLYDNIGRLLENFLDLDNYIRLDLSKYGNGVYFFTVTDNNSGKVYSGKLVKE